MNLFVVVPCYNEAHGIGRTLEALAAQSDAGFSLVIVDNGSTDASRATIADFHAAHPALGLQCIDEPQKGTGAAADTGFRFAIAAGATHVARTDADCIPRSDWISSIRRAFADGAEFVAGRIGFRSDDCRLSAFERASFALIAGLMVRIAPLLSHNRDPRFKAPYVMAGGGNLAVTAHMYLLSGGFPRIRLEDDNDDRGLTNRVRLLTSRVKRDRRMVVHQSARRVKLYGIRNSILWYMNRRYRPDNVDVR